MITLQQSLLTGFIPAVALYFLSMLIGTGLRRVNKHSKHNSDLLLGFTLIFITLPILLVGIFFVVFYLALSISYAKMEQYSYILPALRIAILTFVVSLLLLNICGRYIRKLRERELREGES